MPTIRVLFYRSVGLSWLPGLIIRLATRRRGQRLADVPSHVAISFIITTNCAKYSDVYQMVARGVALSLSVPQNGLLRALDVTIPDPNAALYFCSTAYHERYKYDWRDIWADTLGFCLHRPIAVSDRGSYDCATFVRGALVAGGLHLADTRDPVSPNDLLCLLTAPTEPPKYPVSTTLIPQKEKPIMAEITAPSLDQVLEYAATKNYTALIPYAGQQLVGNTTVIDEARKNPTASVSALTAAVMGSLKHQWRGKIGFLVDFLWSIGAWTAALQVAVAQQIAANLNQVNGQWVPIAPESAPAPEAPKEAAPA